jgi:hypothetical protein
MGAHLGMLPFRVCDLINGLAEATASYELVNIRIRVEKTNQILISCDMRKAACRLGRARTATTHQLR